MTGSRYGGGAVTEAGTVVVQLPMMSDTVASCADGFAAACWSDGNDGEGGELHSKSVKLEASGLGSNISDYLCWTRPPLPLLSRIWW